MSTFRSTVELNLCQYCPRRHISTYFGGGTPFQQFFVTAAVCCAAYAVHLVKISKNTKLHAPGAFV